MIGWKRRQAAYIVFLVILLACGYIIWRYGGGVVDARPVPPSALTAPGSFTKGAP